MDYSSFRKISVTLIALVVIAGSLAAADIRFRARQATGDDPAASGKGQCDIRVKVSSEATVLVRGDMVDLRTPTGAAPQDDGSECNVPMPGRGLRDFSLEVKERRKDVALVEPPSPGNGFQAVVRIRDAAGRFGLYHFRLTWLAEGNSLPAVRRTSIAIVGPRALPGITPPISAVWGRASRTCRVSGNRSYSRPA